MQAASLNLQSLALVLNWNRFTFHLDLLKTFR